MVGGRYHREQMVLGSCEKDLRSTLRRHSPSNPLLWCGWLAVSLKPPTPELQSVSSGRCRRQQSPPVPKAAKQTLRKRTAPEQNQPWDNCVPAAVRHLDHFHHVTSTEHGVFESWNRATISMKLRESRLSKTYLNQNRGDGALAQRVLKKWHTRGSYRHPICFPFAGFWVNF